MNAQAARLSNLDIDNAIKNDEFEVQFQPIFDLSNGALARLEAFVRWRHAALGVLPPGAFIPFFEAQGRMGELTRHILTSALAAYTDWRGPFPPGLSINLALSDLSDETFNDAFAAALADFEFAPSLVTLECPAPPINEDPRRVAERFARLRETGARLAIEVRGRTNDFLHHADPFPFQEIKTGGAAILRFARTVRGPGLSAISELLELADDKSAAITAVGVEDQASLTALRGLGFSAAQGNHLSPAGDLAAFRPSHVNTVREKMGLEALSKEALASMFKLATNGPDFGSIRGGRATTPAADRTVNRGAALKKAGESYDTLIDRLSERIETEGAASARAANLAKLKAMKRKRDEARRAAIPAAELAEMAAGRGGEADGDDADDRQARDLQSRLTEAFASDGQQDDGARAKAVAVDAAGDSGADAPGDGRTMSDKDKATPTRKRSAARKTAKETPAAADASTPVATGEAGPGPAPDPAQDAFAFDDAPAAAPSADSGRPETATPAEAAADAADLEEGAPHGTSDASDASEPATDAADDASADAPVSKARVSEDPVVEEAVVEEAVVDDRAADDDAAPIAQSPDTVAGDGAEDRSDVSAEFEADADAAPDAPQPGAQHDAAAVTARETLEGAAPVAPIAEADPAEPDAADADAAEAGVDGAADADAVEEDAVQADAIAADDPLRPTVTPSVLQPPSEAFSALVRKVAMKVPSPRARFVPVFLVGPRYTAVPAQEERQPDPAPAPPPPGTFVVADPATIGGDDPVDAFTFEAPAPQRAPEPIPEQGPEVAAGPTFADIIRETEAAVEASRVAREQQQQQADGAPDAPGAEETDGRPPQPDLVALAEAPQPDDPQPGALEPSQSGDADDTSEAPQRPARRRKRRKNILTRKYQWPVTLWRSVTQPTHFWPRSWTRARRRRAQERAAAAAAAAAAQEH